MKRNSGFTLIEILVVITIISILSALTLQVVGGMLEQSKISATQATISKIQGLINQRAQGLDRLILRKGYLSNMSGELSAVATDYPAIPKSTQLTIAKKMLEVKYFPQLPSDIYDHGIYPPKLLSAKPSEIFYYFLTQTAVSDTPIGIDAFSDREVRDTDSNDMPEFIDAWGTPLRFYRWPTRFFRSGGQTGPHAVQTPILATDIANARQLFSTLPVFTGNLSNDLSRDPHDPLGECLTNVQNFETAFVQMYKTPLTNPAQFTPIRMHTPATFHVYLVVSAGPDKTFGMGDPEDTTGFGYLGIVTNPAALADDIISLNTKAGGK